MCQYSASDGLPDDWHLVHLGSRAVGGAGLVMTEATSVSPEGRISPEDTGIWNETQGVAWKRIAHFIRDNGAVAGIQLAHAGRKASTYAPWRGRGSVPVAEGGWPTIAPSACAFDGYATPAGMTRDDMQRVKQEFVDATVRSYEAGFQVVEVHAAHGYLLHQFLSPLANLRIDEYGGDFDNRVRYVVEVVEAVRASWPVHLPLFVRLSATDWVEGGWSLAESVELARILAEKGVDLVDTSSGGIVPDAQIDVRPGYQVPFSDAIKNKTGVATASVGAITSVEQAEQVLVDGAADAVFMAREMLRDPYTGLHGASELGVDLAWPEQYDRAKPAVRV